MKKINIQPGRGGRYVFPVFFTFVLPLAGLLLFTLTSCGSGSNDPAKVAENLVVAINKGDFETASKLSTTAFQQNELAAIKKNTVGREIKAPEILDKTIKVEEKTDSTARVFVGMKVKDSDFDVMVTVSLRKEKGEWLANSLRAEM